MYHAVTILGAATGKTVLQVQVARAKNRIPHETFRLKPVFEMARGSGRTISEALTLMTVRLIKGYPFGTQHRLTISTYGILRWPLKTERPDHVPKIFDTSEFPPPQYFIKQWGEGERHHDLKEICVCVQNVTFCFVLRLPRD